MKRLLGLLALALPFAAPASAQPGRLGTPPVERHFQDWLLVCDNVRVCRAQVTGFDGSLMIRRDPGPAGAVVVMLDGQQPNDGPFISDLASIRVDGGAAPGGWRLDRESQSARLDGPAGLAFARAIANARTVHYRAGTDAHTISLAGLTAALLAMDEIQGRVGTVTATIRPGARAAAAVPAALPVPALWAQRPSAAPVPRGFAAAVRRSHAAALRRADCEPGHDDNDDAQPLSNTEALVFIGCRLYNTSFGSLLLRASRADPRRATVIVLPPAPGEDGASDGSGVYSDMEWDAATATLSSGGHSCAGSCGGRTNWTFDGRAFQLSAHSTYEAGGAEPLEYYRTQIRIRR